MQTNESAPKSRLDRMIDDLTSAYHPVGSCFCCGAELPADRKLICESCSYPNGSVARTARMLRGKYVQS
jgi:predicted amidophosphoribosyltransferase